MYPSYSIDNERTGGGQFTYTPNSSSYIRSLKNKRNMLKAKSLNVSNVAVVPNEENIKVQNND